MVWKRAFWGLSLLVAITGCDEKPTRAELIEKVDELQAENDDLRQKLAEAKDAAQQAADAAENGEIDDAKDSAQQAADAADEDN